MAKKYARYSVRYMLLLVAVLALLLGSWRFVINVSTNDINLINGWDGWAFADSEGMIIANLNGGTISISDASLRQLREWNRYRELKIISCPITKSSMPLLSRASNLEILELDNCPLIGDSGLIHLYDLKKLKRVSLLGTAVTEQGVATLKQALPRCEVVSEGQPPT